MRSYKVQANPQLGRFQMRTPRPRGTAKVRVQVRDASTRAFAAVCKPVQIDRYLYRPLL